MPANKVFLSCNDAVADVFDGATVMIGGFGSYGGLPVHLIEALANQGAKELTIISNMGGRGFEMTKLYKPGGYQDVGALYAKCQVKKFIGAVPTLGGLPSATPLEIQHRDGKVDIEMVPIGTLVERIRAGAGGLGGFYTPTGVGTPVAKGKETRVINGTEYLLELPLTSDFALIKAHKADTLGNLVYRGTARCFNSVMAMAAKTTIVEVDQIVPAGELDPEAVVTPHLYVSRVVEVAR